MGVYLDILKLFKFALLIPSTRSEVEHSFSTMNLLVSSLHTSLNDPNVDRLMWICIDGPTNFSDNELEQMVDIFHGSNDRRIACENFFIQLFSSAFGQCLHFLAREDFKLYFVPIVLFRLIFDARSFE